MNDSALAREFAAGQLSPVERVSAVISRIETLGDSGTLWETLEPRLNAFAGFIPEKALDPDRTAEAELPTAWWSAHCMGCR